MGRVSRFLATSVVVSAVASAYRADTDSLREVCSGMWGGKDASIELSFDSSSSGQVALVMYEWKDVPYLGADTPDNSVGDPPKTYICTTSAVRQGLCSTSGLGSFITTLPEDKPLDSTSIFTQAIKFSTEDREDEQEEESLPSSGDDDTEPLGEMPSEGEEAQAGSDDEGWAQVADPFKRSLRAKRQFGDIIGGITGSIGGADKGDEETSEPTEAQLEDWENWSPPDEPEPTWDETPANNDELDEQPPSTNQEDEPNNDEPNADEQPSDQDQPNDENTEPQGDQDEQPSEPENQNDGSSNEEAGDNNDAPIISEPSGDSNAVVTYSRPITYSVKKTGYYCIGIVPVTLVNSKRSDLDIRQQATHAEYSGMVEFHNVFEGELPAVEYPKINFYLLLSVLYTALACGWAFLCIKHRDELLPMQYYISGTIVFLIIEMLANFAYYRYINKHGGGATSLAFLFVVSILNAARNSLSFFLLLIVSMGLSVVRQNLGGVMGRVRVLTGMHFVFGVLYSVGTVEVELDSAALVVVMLLIFPLALTLTAFLMWIIVSLNGTIMFLQQHKQRMKLQMFQRLWRILIMAVIAIAAFFVVSSMSLSNRLDEDYAPNNWRYRWLLLDGSLAIIYLVVFAAIAWIWRPTANNRSFAMSQELAQDEGEADDAEDYEFSNLDNGREGHQPLTQGDDEDEDDDRKRYGRTRGVRGDVEDENTVFALDDSDEDASDVEGRHVKKGKGKGEYRDDASDEEDFEGSGLKKGD